MFHVVLVNITGDDRLLLVVDYIHSLTLFFSSASQPLTVFSGGMPRASYGDRHTVSIMQGDNHVVAELTSRVVDFLVMSRADEKDATEIEGL